MLASPPFTHKPVDLGYDDLGVSTLESGRTYTTPSGKGYSSITTILGQRGNEWVEDWKANVGEKEAARVLHHALVRGNHLHDSAELFINNDEVNIGSHMPHVQFSLKRFLPILQNRVTDVMMQEAPLYSDELEVAGRVDLIANFDNELSIIDFKTSTKRKKAEDIENYFLQATAYSMMLEERTKQRIDKLVIIMMVDYDPNPIIFIESRNRWEDKLREVIEEFNYGRGK